MAAWPVLQNGRAVLKLMGLYDPDKRRQGRRTRPDVPVNRFFNRLMILPLDMANQLFRAFSATMEHNIESAKAMGIFDAGAELIRASHLKQDGPTRWWSTRTRPPERRRSSISCYLRTLATVSRGTRCGGTTPCARPCSGVKASGRLLAVSKESRRPRRKQRPGARLRNVNRLGSLG